MTTTEVLERKDLKNRLPGLIVDYYRNPSDHKMALILKRAARLHALEGDSWYLIGIRSICVRILYACDHDFIDYIETKLRNV